MIRRCPHCQQVLPEVRVGVRLPPLKARIFDLVLRGGEDGITARDVLEIVYAELEGPSAKTVHVHVFQINELIEDSGYRIVGRRGPGSVYRLVNKRAARRVAA